MKAVISKNEINRRCARLMCKKNPKTKSPHIGLEFEFFTQADKYTILKNLSKAGLHNYCYLTTDNSIDPDDCCSENCWEICVLVSQMSCSRILKKVISCLNKIKAKINNTCGLHIHVDCRRITNRNPEQVFFSLMKMQKILFNFCPERMNNHYCQFTDFNLFNDALYSSRYYAINASAYGKYKTIEVRLLHGTLNLDEIESFINCLKFAVYNAENLKSLMASNVNFEWNTNHILNDKKFIKPKTQEFLQKVFSNPK